MDQTGSRSLEIGENKGLMLYVQSPCCSWDHVDETAVGWPIGRHTSVP